MISNTMELTEQEKKELAEARKEIKAGKYVTLSEVKKDLK